MKTLLKITGITIALAAIGVAVRAKDKDYISTMYNKRSGSKVTITGSGIESQIH